MLKLVVNGLFGPKPDVPPGRIENLKQDTGKEIYTPPADWVK
jgi:hypothetical protein